MHNIVIDQLAREPRGGPAKPGCLPRQRQHRSTVRPTRTTPWSCGPPLFTQRWTPSPPSSAPSSSSATSTTAAKPTWPSCSAFPPGRSRAPPRARWPSCGAHPRADRHLRDHRQPALKPHRQPALNQHRHPA